MTQVHLVYPHGPRISCPDAIGRNLAAQLSTRYEVRLHDWDARGVIRPGTDDVLLGHPHPSPRTIFRRSLRDAGWGRRLILAPYNHGDLRQSAWLDPLVRASDLFLALTGDHWFDTAPMSAFAHWVPKMVHMDLAIDPTDFPPIKRVFNPPGRRRFLFIGHSHWTKNVGYLSKLARRMRRGTVAWMGTGNDIPGVTSLGLQDFRDPSALGLVEQHDFLISVGRADANPAAVLEAMAWGLIPACSAASAHADLPGIVLVPLDDADGAVRVLEGLQETDEASLQAMQEMNRHALESRFTWARFGERVVSAIESDRSPPVLPASPRARTRLATARVTSPYGWWRPARIRDELRGSLRRRMSVPR